MSGHWANMLTRLGVLGTAAFSTLACLDTGTNVTRAELRVAGETDATFAGRDGWQIELQRARVAFGPLWLCAGKTAGELCDVARAEWLDAVVVDALDQNDKVVGELWGSEGDVRSWMYDYGLVSLLTTPVPFQTEAAKSLSGNSVSVDGCATKEEQSVCFAVELPVAQGTDAEQGIPVVRVSGDDTAITRFGTERRVTAMFDAAQWLETVDFDALIAEHACEGCDEIQVASSSQAARAVRSALEGTARPRLVWKR